MKTDTFNHNENEYLTYGQIQTTISEFYLKHGYKISLKEAVDILKLKKETYTSLPENPDFSDWDINNHLTLKYVINKFPMGVNDLINNIFKKPSFLDLDKMHDIKDVFFLQKFNDCPVSMRNHNFYEIYYVLYGSCTILLDNESFNLNENEFFFIAPYVKNSPLIEGENILLSFLIRPSTFEKTFFNLLIQNNLLSDFFGKTLHDEKARINHLHFKIDNPTEINTLLKLILIEFHKSNNYSNDICIHLMSIIFSIILRDYEKHINFYDLNQTIISENSNFNLILKYIEQNYSTISLNKLSDVFNYDKDYLGKIIKKNTGYNFTELINNLRLKNACLLLKNKNFKVLDVSEIVGFNNPGYFAKKFRKAYGCTPKRYIDNI